MSIPIATTLFSAQTTDAASAEFLHNGGPQGIYVLGVLDNAMLQLESKLPTTEIDTFVPVLNGSFHETDLCPTEYTVGSIPAVGLLKVMTSTPGTYRLRLIGSRSNTTVWAYMIGS